MSCFVFQELQNIRAGSADICFTPEHSNFDDANREKIGNISFTLINCSCMVNGKDGDSDEDFM